MNRRRVSLDEVRYDVGPVERVHCGSVRSLALLYFAAVFV
jgi:hypothetical protein